MLESRLSLEEHGPSWFSNLFKYGVEIDEKGEFKRV